MDLDPQPYHLVIDPHVTNAIICLMFALFVALGLSLYLLEEKKKR